MPLTYSGETVFSPNRQRWHRQTRNRAHRSDTGRSVVAVTDLRRPGAEVRDTLRDTLPNVLDTAVLRCARPRIAARPRVPGGISADVPGEAGECRGRPYGISPGNSRPGENRR